jgi:transcriptional regulator with XRE-family HTH domain
MTMHAASSSQGATTRKQPKLDTLGGRLRAVREKMKMSVVEAAKEVGVSRTSFGQWESDAVKNPDTGALMTFSKLADISLDWLLARQGPDPDFNKSPTESLEVPGRESAETGKLELHPLLVELLRQIPPSGNDWSDEEQAAWLQTFGSCLKMVRGKKPPTET